jgi:hypothetical protein
VGLPTEEELRWLVSRYARFLAAHGEAIGRPELVLPTGDYFPDEVSVDPEGVLRIARRILRYAPVSDDIHLALGVLPEDESTGGGGCGSGACGTGPAGTARGGEAIETAEGYALTLAPRDAGHPTLLTTALVRAAGHVVLQEAEEDLGDDPIGARSELSASAVGLGVLLLSGAHVYGKSCGGVSIRQATHLCVEEHATLLALFCRVHDAKPSLARPHLGATQREALDSAVVWIDSNPNVVQALKLHPGSLADGLFPIERPKGLLGRLFGRKPPQLEPAPTKRRARTEAEERRLAEAKALVDDALGLK